ncbi:serine/arginine repetitive matrix protein 2 [Streptomyces tsukubensis]|uniref:serine/arginine repetitive matrix protein 2 n=1 Tax=Streptomyces tsukubensis TaxID=83656 RepID=UPI003450DC62
MSGGTYWNPDTQRWEESEPQPYGPPPPLPPPPPFPPAVPGPDGSGAAPVLPWPDPEPEFRIGGTAGRPSGGTGGAVGVEDAGTVRRRPPAVAVVAAALAAVAVASVLWFTAGPGADDDAKTPTSEPSASETSEPSEGSDASGSADGTDPSGTSSAPPESADPSPSASATVPDGYEVRTDPVGFTLAVPQDWSRTIQGGSVFYTSPDGRSLVQVFEITEPGYTPVEAVEKADEGLAAQAADYLRHGLGPVAGGPENPSGDAAELLYAYSSTDAGGPRECIERVFTAADYALYAVLTCAPAEESPAERTLLDNALAHFAP